MPFEDFVVCDSDMHVLEPADLWQRYIAKEFEHAAPVGMTELKRDLRVKIKSQVLLKTGPVRPLKERGGSGIGWRTEQEAAYAEAEAKGWGPEAQLDAMAKEGVDLAVLFPSRGLFALTIDSSEQIDADGLEVMLSDGKVGEGMIPKLRSCIDAVTAGVARAHVLDGRVPHALLLEFFTREGIGTMITNEVAP